MAAKKYPRLHSFLDKLIESMVENNASVGSMQFEIPGCECVLIVSLDTETTQLLIAAQSLADPNAETQTEAEA